MTILLSLLAGIVIGVVGLIAWIMWGFSEDGVP